MDPGTPADPRGYNAYGHSGQHPISLPNSNLLRQTGARKRSWRAPDHPPSALPSQPNPRTHGTGSPGASHSQAQGNTQARPAEGRKGSSRKGSTEEQEEG